MQQTENALGYMLLQGSASDREILPEASVDLVVTSPPYNVGMPYNGNPAGDLMAYEKYLEFNAKWLKNVFFWTKDTGRLCLNVGLDKNKAGKRPVCSDMTRLAMQIGWNYHATIIWNEGNINRRTAWGSWKSASAPHVIAPVEVVIVLYKGEWKRKRQGQSDITAEEFKKWVLGVWDFRGESAKRVGHEAPFPRELPRRCIKLFSFVGDTVLDPFAGSGTTLIEAICNKRKAMGIELEEKYCDLSRKRIDKMTQEELIRSYYVKRPGNPIPTSEVVDWATVEWQKDKKTPLIDPDGAIRKLAQSGMLVKIGKGVYKYDPGIIKNPVSETN